MLSGIMTAHDISAQSETAGRHNNYHLSMSIVPRADEQICSFLIQRFVWLCIHNVAFIVFQAQI